MFKKLIYVGILIICACLSAADVKLKQDQFDVIVERTMFRFIHGDDWREAVEHWKERGATDEMFAEAYAKIAKRNMNASVGTEASYKCLWSLTNGLGVHARPEQLTNLVFIVEHSKQDHIRGCAVYAYHERTAGTKRYVDFAERMLNATNLTALVGERVFVGLDLDVRKMKDDGDLKQRAVSLARSAIERENAALVSADAFLEDHDRTYRGSRLQAKAIRSVLDGKTINVSEETRKHFLQTRKMLERK